MFIVSKCYYIWTVSFRNLNPQLLPLVTLPFYMNIYLYLPTPETIFLCNINLRSVKNKQTELCNILSSMEPDVVIVDEMHLYPVCLDAGILPYGIPDEHRYTIFRKDRKALNGNGGGGVMIMVKPGYDCEECPDMDTECDYSGSKSLHHGHI